MQRADKTAQLDALKEARDTEPEQELDLLDALPPYRISTLPRHY